MNVVYSQVWSTKSSRVIGIQWSPTCDLYRSNLRPFHLPFQLMLVPFYLLDHRLHCTVTTIHCTAPHHNPWLLGTGLLQGSQDVSGPHPIQGPLPHLVIGLFVFDSDRPPSLRSESSLVHWTQTWSLISWQRVFTTYMFVSFCIVTAYQGKHVYNEYNEIHPCLTECQHWQQK